MTVSAGPYKIVPASSDLPPVGIMGDPHPDAPLQVTSFDPRPIMVTPVGGDQYELYRGCPIGLRDDGGNIYVGLDYDHEPYRWEISPGSGSGQYRIRTTNTNLYWTVCGTGPINMVTLQDDQGAPEQEWRLVRQFDE